MRSDRGRSLWHVESEDVFSRTSAAHDLDFDDDRADRLECHLTGDVDADARVLVEMAHRYGPRTATF